MRRDLEQKLTVTSAHLRSAEAAIAELESQGRSTDQSLATAQAELEDNGREIDELLKQNERKDQDMADLRGQLGLLKGDLTSQESKLGHLDAAYKVELVCS